ncbi:MAG: serine protease [Alphaproteobacteria bacterium]|nr:serine protease [Alphaproteobacteria bacterium]
MSPDGSENILSSKLREIPDHTCILTTGAGYGSGVFISEDLVLTARHCVRNKEGMPHPEKVAVVNSLGNLSLSLAEGENGAAIIHEDSDLDLAVIKISEKIGPAENLPFISTQKADLLASQRRGKYNHLASVLSNANNRYEILLNQNPENLPDSHHHKIQEQETDLLGGWFVVNAEKNKKTGCPNCSAVFSSAVSGCDGIYIGPGYSGSPILDRFSRIASIVTHKSKTWKDHKSFDVGRIVESPPSIIGPSPDKFARFMDIVLGR